MADLTFDATIGPVWSGWGMRNWNLCFRGTDVALWPYTTGESWKLALSLQFPFIDDPGARFRRLAVTTGLRECLLTARKVEWLSSAHLRCVRVEKRWSQNAIVFDIHGHRERYFRLHDRTSTERCRHLLRSRFGELYRETGFGGWEGTLKT